MIENSTPTQGPRMDSQVAAKWSVVAALIVIGLVALYFARLIVAPIDGFVTEQTCSLHGDELSRDVLDYEQSNRFGLVDRSYGWCLYGPVQVDENEAELVEDEVIDPDVVPLAGSTADESVDLQLTIEQIEPGGMYRAMKLMGIIVQLGAASVVVRAAGDPLLNRFVRSGR